MANIGVYSELVNQTINSINVFTGYVLTEKNQREIEDYSIIQKFLVDYASIFNMDIRKMSNFMWNQSVDLGDDRLRKDNTFLRQFSKYVILKKYIKKESANFYRLHKLAKKALDIIQKYGDGGNLKVYLKVTEDQIEPIYNIIDKRYFLPYYKGFGTLVYPYSDTSLYYLSEKDSNNTTKITLVTKKDKYGNRYISLLKKELDFSKADKKIEDYRRYKTTFYSSITRIYLNRKEFKNKLFNKYYKYGIVFGQQYNLLNQPIIAYDIKNILLRYSKLNKKINSENIKRAFSGIKSNLFVKRKIFFKILVQSLNFNKYYKSISNCKNLTKEACILKKKKISNGKYSDRYLTLNQLLMFMENIDKNIGGKK